MYSDSEIGWQSMDSDSEIGWHVGDACSEIGLKVCDVESEKGWNADSEIKTQRLESNMYNWMDRCGY